MPKNAKAGGEISKVNGAFYKGGHFMPDHGEGKAPKIKAKGKKVEIAPYVWAVPEDGYTSIFKRISHITNIHTNQVLTEALEYYQVPLDIAQTYLNLYNQGYRWIIETAPYQPLENQHTEEWFIEKA